MRHVHAFGKWFGRLRRSPGFALAFVTSLAVGLAAACAAFAVGRRAFLDPLPYPQPDRLVTIRTVVDGRTSLSSSFLVGEDLKSSPVFAGISADWGRTVVYEAPGGSERLTAGVVTPNYFEVVGVRPILGAPLTEATPDGVVVSWPLFERALAADAAAIGRSITIDGVPLRVVGVMPKGFAGPYLTEAELWLPLDTRPMRTEEARGRGAVILQGRMADGVSIEDARAFLGVFGEQERRSYPSTLARHSWVVHSLREVLVEPSRTLLIATAAATALMMLIVLANIAGLAAARAEERRRADAVRLALGASPARLLRERLAESLSLAGIGTAGGLWLASLFITWVTAHQQQFQLFLEDVPVATFEPGVAALGLVLGVVAGVVAAVVPHRAIRSVQADELLGSGRGFGGPRLARTRAILVGLQVTVAVVLLIAAGLLVRTVRSIGATRIGFNTETLVTFGVSLPAARYGDAARVLQFETQVIEHLQQVSGVTGATAAVGFPSMGGPLMRVALRGQPAADQQLAVYFSVAPRFFSFLGLPLSAGRDFEATDTLQAPAVVIVNEMMAQRRWPDGRALGSRFRIGVGSAFEREVTVIGVVGNVHQDGPAREIRPTAYASTHQLSGPSRTFAIRTSKPLAAIAPGVRAAALGVDPLLAPSTPLTLDWRLGTQTVQQRFAMSLLTLFGALAAGLCALGLYAVVSLTAQGRRREFAVRLALGAPSSLVGWLVVRQSLTIAAIGGAAGLAAALALTGGLRALLHGVERSDPLTMAAAVFAVVGLAVAASLVPALRSARIDPVTVLKSN